MLLVGLVLLLPLQLDGDQASLGGQSGQLFHSIHDVGGMDWNADHPSLASCHAGLGEEHHLLKIELMCDEGHLQVCEDGAVGVVELKPVGDGHRRNVALLEGALAGGAEVSEARD